MFGQWKSYRSDSFATKRTLAEILRFTLFSRHVVFNGEGDKLRNKRIEKAITVSVVIDMECGNTKNWISNNRHSRRLSQKACGFFFAQKQKGGICDWGLYRNRLQKPENSAGEAMQPPKIGFSKKKSTILPTKYSAFYMEITGIEPVTSCMPCKRSPSWAKPPDIRCRPWRR